MLIVSYRAQSGYISWLVLLVFYNLRPFQNILLCPALSVLMTRGGDVLYCHPNSFCSAATGSLGCPAVPTVLQPNTTTACQIGSLLHVLSSDRSISCLHLKLCWEFYMNTFPLIMLVIPEYHMHTDRSCTKSLCSVQNETWSQMRSKVRLLQTPHVITCTFQMNVEHFASHVTNYVPLVIFWFCQCNFMHIVTQAHN